MRCGRASRYRRGFWLTLKDATVVPDVAIQHGANGLDVYSVNQDNKAELHQVKVSQLTDGRSVMDAACRLGSR